MSSSLKKENVSIIKEINATFSISTFQLDFQDIFIIFVIECSFSNIFPKNLLSLSFNDELNSINFSNYLISDESSTLVSTFCINKIRV